MHSVEWNERISALPSHRFKGATGIANAIFSESASNMIGNLALDSLEPRILPLCSKAANQISALFNLSQQSRDVAGIVLQITIDQNQHIAARGMQSGIDRGALAGVLFEL